MDDKELLEKAARAAGIEVSPGAMTGTPVIHGTSQIWNPLKSNSDAFRLMVSLAFVCDVTSDMVHITGWGGREIHDKLGDDPMAATRRAIVRAAAAMVGGGRSEMPTVTFVPRHVAEKAKGAGITLLSITHPGEIADVDNFESVYRVAFDDVELPTSGHVMFDLDMAQGVIRLLDLGYQRLWIHCEAGMSRSAAVAKWATDRRGYTLEMHPEGVGTAQHYNRHVYRTLDAADGRDMAAYYAELERNARMMM